MARVIDCPKCGVSQPEDVFCANCGVRIKSFQQATRTSKTKESAIISLVAVLFLGLGIYFVQKTVRKTFNLIPKDEIQIDNDEVQAGPSAVTQKGYRLSQTGEAESVTATSDSRANENAPQTAEATPAAAAPTAKPLQGLRVKFLKVSAESMRNLGGAQATTGDSQLNILKTAQAPKGTPFQVEASQGWPVRVEEPLTFQTSNGVAANTNAAAAANTNPEPDGIFLSVTKVEGGNGLILDGEIKVTNLLATGPLRLNLHSEWEMGADETAVFHGFMPRDAVKPGVRFDTSSPFSVLQDQAFMSQTSDIAILLEGSETP